uniref:Uncharacterized protein n=1 Tax=Triticum urartu TaxID=4572 RepID=A0A8R7Q4W0_TRIUA
MNQSKRKEKKFLWMMVAAHEASVVPLGRGRTGPVIEPCDDVEEDLVDVLRQLAGGEGVPHARVELERLVRAGRLPAEELADGGVRDPVASPVHDQEGQRHLREHLALDAEAGPEELVRRLEPRPPLVAVGVAADLVALGLRPVGGADDVPGGHHLPRRDEPGDGLQHLDHRRVRLHLLRDLAHGRHQHGPRPVGRPRPVEQQRHRAAHGLAQQEPRQLRRLVGGDGGGEVGVAVAEEDVEGGDVAPEAVRLAVALVVHAVDGVAGLRQPHPGAAHRHAALHRVTVAHEDEGLDWSGVGGEPPAGEELHPTRVLDVFFFVVVAVINVV